MERLTKDNPQENFETMMNYVFAKDGWAHIRHDGESEDVPLTTWAKSQCIKRGCDEFPGETAEEIDEVLCDCLMDGEGCPVALAYCFACQASHLRDRLKAIEDILGDEYDLDHLRELARAEKDGRLVVLEDGGDNAALAATVGKDGISRVWCGGDGDLLLGLLSMLAGQVADKLGVKYGALLAAMMSKAPVKAPRVAEELAQENGRLRAENKRLHEENFWLTGGLGFEKE